MRLDNSDQKNFLLELHIMTGGDTEQQISIHDIGKKLGMDKTATSSISETLMIDGLIDMKTLSGGISISNMGVETLQEEGLVVASSGSEPLTLSNEPLISSEDRSVIEQILEEIRSTLFAQETPFNRLEELVIDVKTIETQLLSPRPKTSIILSVLQSVQAGFENLGEKKIAVKLSTFRPLS